MSNRTIWINSPDNEELWFKCAWCNVPSTHKVLTLVEDKSSEDISDDTNTYEDALWWINVHQIVQCQNPTCERISYRRESRDSENQGDEELGIPDQYEVINYPGDFAQRIFEEYRTRVDSLLLKSCRDVIRKIPIVYRRLSERDDEAISQALNSCRRIIVSFAQTIYLPPENEQEVDIQGKLLKLSSQNYCNLIEAYVREHTTSTSRRDRIRTTVRALNDRVCTGVHAEVTSEEAQALFLQTYLLIGEILSLE